MAIIIPSSKIFKKENAKIRDNAIGRLEIGSVNIVPQNEFMTSVENAKLDISGTQTAEDGERITIYNTQPTSDFPMAATGNFIRNKYVTVAIEFPKSKDNKYISRIYNGTNNANGQSYMQTAKIVNSTAYYYRSDGSFVVADDGSATNNFVGNFDFSVIDSYVGALTTLRTDTMTSVDDVVVGYALEDTEAVDGFVDKFGVPTVEYASIYDVDENPKDVEVNAVMDMTNYVFRPNSFQIFAESETIGSGIVVQETDTKYILSNIKVLVEREIYACASAVYINASEVGSQATSYPSEVVKVVQRVEECELTVYGNTLGISVLDFTSVLRSGGDEKKVLSLQGSEIMQSGNVIGTASAIQSSYADTLRQYQNGKETATVKCIVSDYYDEGGELKISTTQDGLPMAFRVQDEVVPMVYGVNGEDEPMSKNADGTRKAFKVLGSSISFSGAIYQILYLQEC